MGEGANRNKLCKCGSGKKVKNCNCKLSRMQKIFPNGNCIENDQMIFHVLGVVSEEDYPGLNELDEEKRFYAPFCNLDQIERIFNPTNGRDELLKYQVDSVLNNMRVKRVFYNRYNTSEDWDIEKQFDDSIFKVFMLLIGKNSKYEFIKSIPCGMTYDSDANGQCIKTKFGNVITVSSLLKQYLYYMNLFYVGIFEENIPNNVVNNALVLAIRIMLQTEALDFEIDPRGTVPEHIHDQITAYTNYQLMFVLAHEFSHSLLGHLDNHNVLFSHESNQTIYNQSQKQELEADIEAINLLSEEVGYEIVANNAINFFMAIDIYEQAKEQIFPSMNVYKTHPIAEDRIKNIIDNSEENTFDFEKIMTLNRIIKESLMEIISVNMESFEEYGSIYLAEWHDKMLIDRVDY